MSAVSEIQGKGGTGKAAGVPRMGILGTRGAGIWGSGGGTIYSGAGAGRSWWGPERTGVHRRSFGRFSLQVVARGRICESGDIAAPDGWIEIAQGVHCGGGAVRA